MFFGKAKESQKKSIKGNTEKKKLENLEKKEEWKNRLEKGKLEMGIEYNKQNEGWDCGPNSVGRALKMLGMELEYENLKKNCPKTFGKNSNLIDKKNLFSGINMLFEKLPNVGPLPHKLANYMNTQIELQVGSIEDVTITCKSITNKDYKIIFKTISENIKMDLPVVALIGWGINRLHYITLVGISEKDEVLFLETNGALHFYSQKDFESLLDCSSYCYVPAKYNLILFEKRTKNECFF